MADTNPLENLERSMKPYRDEFTTYAHIPKVGRGREEIIAEMEALYDREESRWQDGFMSGTVYHGDREHIDFLNRVYGINSQSNPLHFDTWPSNIKFEAEIVSMTANMLGAERTADEIVGTVSSGGTESILLAIKTYRDWARETKGITEPEMIVPTTAHAAFDKAARFFNVTPVRIPVGRDFRADVEKTRQAITENTVVIVGSAPDFPHGLIDPIEGLSELAREHGIGFHTDACLGGFILPWADKLGYDVPPFDFRLPGVTSMSADTHKYGYAAKGTSVVLYRTAALRHYQYYVATEWPGGLYISPTLAGSRPGGLSAACWAAMVSIGEEGYTDAARRILRTGDLIKAGIREIPELTVLGDPLFNIAFGSDSLDIYAITDHMGERGWGLSSLHRPPCVHICLTLRHTQPGVEERFIADLNEAVDHVKANPDLQGRMGPIYGMAGNVTLDGIVRDIMNGILDLQYKV
jgi:glutamate/tyrosine decarboxylase-like PLP-dependent enzyme